MRTTIWRWVLSTVTGGLLLLPAGIAGQRTSLPDLTFESGDGGALPSGWRATPPGGVARDDAHAHGGRWAARLEREDAQGSSVLVTTLPMDFGGDSIRLVGWIRTEGVEGFAGLWLRQDGPGGVLEFDNMSDRAPTGTSGWARYEITLPVNANTETLYLGALLSGTGRMWVDDLELTVDGGSVEDAPPRPENPVRADHEFDEGSEVDLVEPTAVQVDNLTLLGRVWGFVKYHHPKVTGGDVNWDYELFRVLPDVLSAPDHAAARTAMEGWLGRLGPTPPCEPCATAPDHVHLPSEVEWIGDEGQLGAPLSARLREIHRNRHAAGPQYYVRHVQNVGNPDFSTEAGYPRPALPDPGFRLLALYRFWNIVRYWFPYRNLIDEDWEEVLAAFVPKVLAAGDVDDYRLAMIELSATIDDTHANVWQHLDVRPPRGTAALPVEIRFVEEKAVVSEYTDDQHGPASGLRPGDVIEAIDGRPVDSLAAEWAPWYSASNESTRLRDIARALTIGPPGPVTVDVARVGWRGSLTADRLPLTELDTRRGRTHDLPGEAFQLLSEDVAYLKLSSVVAAETADYVRRAEGTRVLVIDIRNYPSEFVVFALGQHLVDEPTPFARFTSGDPGNPGAFVWGEPVSIRPEPPTYGGEIVVLVDETSLSQAEYTAMAFRAAGATVVGSTTAGADGNVSAIPLPGGIASMISGIGVFYPDRTPTQRVGIVPDLVVRPTIDGIRQGRDEVLEAAVSHALGRPFTLPPR